MIVYLLSQKLIASLKRLFKILVALQLKAWKDAVLNLISILLI